MAEAVIQADTACYSSVLLSLFSPPFMFYERPGQKVLGNTGKAFCPFLSDLYFYALKKNS